MAAVLKRPRLEGESEGKPQLLASLAKLTSAVESATVQARTKFRQAVDIEDFLRLGNKKGISMVYGGTMPFYAECFIANGVATRKELERLWGGLFHDEEVRETVEELLEVEEAFEELMADFDRELQKLEDQHAVANPLSVGDTLPALSLVEAETGEAVPVDKYLKRSKLSLFILVRHFG